MKDKPVARKRPVILEGAEPDETSEDTTIDTVALMCIAVVPKHEYDEMVVNGIEPVVVHGATGAEVKISPFLLVGSADNTRKEAVNRINRVWDEYFKRREGAKK